MFGSDDEDEKPQKQLIIACAHGDLAKIKALIKQPGVDINGVHFIDTPLSAAIDNGHLDAVKLLVSLGANIHTKNPNPLFKAAHRNEPEIVNYLIDLGANPNTIRESVLGDEPVIHNAASWGWDKVVEVLLKRGADPNIQDSNGCTALHRAANIDVCLNKKYQLQQQPIATINALLVHPGIQMLADNKGNLPLHYFVQKQTILFGLHRLVPRDEEGVADESHHQGINQAFDSIFYTYHKLFHATPNPFVLNQQGESYTKLMCDDFMGILSDVAKRADVNMALSYEHDDIADAILGQWDIPRLPVKPENRQYVPVFHIYQAQVMLHRNDPHQEKRESPRPA